VLNRKKLVQLSLSEIPSETEYLDYKRQIDLTSTSGRGKLIRLICAMNNSNPNGQSFIFVGIGDDKSIIGTSFLDDANFQNAVKGFIANPPKVSYENINFKELAPNKFIGIITIYPSKNESYICKSIWKLKEGDKFIRRGSTTDKYTDRTKIIAKQNEIESTQLLQRATVSLGSTLDAVLSFYSESHKEYNPRHYVFNDHSVVGISSWRKENTSYHSEVTVSILNDEVTYFWSALDNVKITCLEQYILIEEQALVFWKGKRIYFPFKLTKLDFSKMGTYSVKKELLLSIPILKTEEISSFIRDFPEKLDADKEYIEILPYELLLAALNGSNEAVSLLFDRNNGNVDGALAESYSEAIFTYNELKGGVVFS
jgi:hypothetical protein